MREIKFRGIAVSDDKFCYGFLTQKQRGTYHIGFHGHYDDVYKYQLVNQHSVGQFTGLTDKNGVEIYENDIIRSVGGIVAQVCFLENNKTCTIGFYLNTPQGFCALLTPDTGGSVEVIGNIHQNPELLK